MPIYSRNKNTFFLGVRYGISVKKLQNRPAGLAFKKVSGAVAFFFSIRDALKHRMRCVKSLTRVSEERNVATRRRAKWQDVI